MNEKVKVLEARRSSHPPLAVDTIAAAEATDVVCPDGDLEPAIAERSTGTSDPVASPSPLIPEESMVPSHSEK